MRVAAVDFGTVRIGLAVSDELGLLAHPRPALSGKNPRAAIAELGRMAVEEGIERFVVGLPVEMRGEEGVAAERVRRFAERLSEQTGREVEFVDERWTTLEASRRLREASGARGAKVRAKVDGAAAAVLLQSWLDRRGAG